jgi:hypothetical protein
LTSFPEQRHPSIMPQKRAQIEEQRPLLEGFEMPSGASRRNFICCVISILICVALFVYVNIELFKWNKAKGGDAWHQVARQINRPFLIFKGVQLFWVFIFRGVQLFWVFSVDQLKLI